MEQTTTATIDYKKLLIAAKDGLDIYKHFLPELKMAEANRCENILNPFYQDTNPSLSIYKGQTIWRHKDHGDGDFNGDALDFAAKYLNIDRRKLFPKLLKELAKRMNLDLAIISEENTLKDPDHIAHSFGFWLNGDPFNDVEGLEGAFEFFKDYGITKEILKRYRVKKIQYYLQVDQAGKIQQTNISKMHTVIAYQDVDFCKLYIKYEDAKSFRYLGNKPKDFVFGMKNLFRIMQRQETLRRKLLIITGGEKDVLTLTSLGYDAVSLNSETANLPQGQFRDFITLFDRVVVLYDLDETGIKNANRLSNLHGFDIAMLPDELTKKRGKDVSDYIKLGLPVDTLHTIIRNSQKLKIQIKKEDTDFVQKEATLQPFGITPFLPEEIYDFLPETIRDFCEPFRDQRDRDIVLLSSLGILSSCFPTVKGVYDNSKVGCNFNLFISAPASSGKGAMTWSRSLGMYIHRSLRERYKVEMTEYQIAIAKYNSRKTEDQNNSDAPEIPKEKLFYIPANSACSSVIENLDANKTFGVIFDSEGDTLSSTMKNEWGDFSTVIRKSFHHEPISIQRRTNKEIREVEIPHLSLVLSGTPGQISNLFNGVEDGLFSRFLFYDFTSPIEWKDQFGEGDDMTQNTFDSLAKRIFDFWCKNNEISECLVQLTIEQRSKINAYYNQKLKTLHSFHGDDIVANVKRTCLVYYRIAMILTVIRYYDAHYNLPEKIEVSDQDSQVAFLIVNTLLDHLEVVFTRLSISGPTSKLKNNQKLFIESLPTEFLYAEFLKIGAQLGINENTAYKYRDLFLKLGLIESPQHGKYRKLK